jgi:hypothetical protein
VWHRRFEVLARHDGNARERPRHRKEGRLGQDLSEAVSLRLDATPTIFINGRKYTGFRDDAAFALAVNLANPAEFHGTQNSAVQPAK